MSVLVLAGASPIIGADPVSAREFAPRSGPRGATLFATLPAEQTGIRVDNTYSDPKMWAERYREFSLGAIGSGVAIGDYDADGLPDICIVSKVAPSHLFRNLGGFRFEDVTEKAGLAIPPGTWKQGAAFADVNNDGRLDLYVTRYAAPNLLYLNQGDGTFKEAAEAAGLAINDASGMACFADYDRDGWLDLYLQTNVLDAEARPNGQRDLLFHNNRDGTFTNVTERAGLFGDTQGHSATWWDYDADGWPDIYVANDFRDPDQLYHNNRDGTFRNVLSFVVPHTPHSSMGADLGDVNNDGWIDLLVADMATTTRAKDHRGMARVRAGLTENETNPEAAPQFMRNALFLGTGVGRVMEAAMLAGLDATDWTWTVRLEDLDNDGRVDAFLTNGMVRELHNADVVKRTSALESLTARTRIWKDTPVLAEHNLAYRNRGDLDFENVSAAWGLDHFGVSFGGALGDLDRDGDLDIVFVNYEGNATVCRNDSDTGERIAFELRGRASNRYGVGATVRLQTSAGRQVRQLVLARGYMSTSEPMLHFGLGAETHVARTTIEWPSGHVQTLENLTAGRRYVVEEPDGPATPTDPPASTPQFVDTSRDQNLSVASRERPNDELTRQPLLPLRHNRIGPGVVVADLDANGEEDLVLGGAAGERAQLLRNLGDGQFMPPMSSAFGTANEAADAMPLLVDVNADGHLDLLLTKGGVTRPPGNPAYQPRLFLNDGSGRLNRAASDLLPAWPESTLAAATADFDRDGTLDVFVGGRVVPGGYPKLPKSALWLNRDGKLVDVTEQVAPGLRQPGLVTAALATDVDGDGWMDLLVACEWGRVSFWRNDSGRTFEDRTERAGFATAGTGWWSSLAAGDLNGDGRPDYVAGNVGLNTRYRADAKHPTLLFAGDLDGSGRWQLLEAQYEGETVYPIRGLPQLQPVMPALVRKFTSFDAYAKAPLEDVVPPERLAAAQRLAATELRSGVFLSQPDGSFRFEPLPRIAQIAPLFGTVVGDVDGDGFADVFAVQNSYAPIPETGRFDGGLGVLLRGNGKGGLTFVPPAESGLVVKHDAKALVRLDWNKDGWPDFVVTRNNDRTLAFRNTAISGRNGFGVTLRGRAGNPQAIGARITTIHHDGRLQAAEVNGGSGYLSHETTTRFFGYPDTNPPREIQVRWPDGQTSTQAWTTPARTLLISAPTP